jgi:type IV secretory pathway VirB4 component
MDTQLNRKLLLNQYHALLTILHERGISYETPSDDEIQKLSDPDLAAINRQLSFLARTPGIQR